MAVKIRLARRGRKKKAMFDVVIADARAPRDGRFIEKIGTYDPNTNPASIKLDDVKAFDWVMKGAQPTDTVKAMLSYRGLLFKKHLQIGVNKGAVTQEQADEKFNQWKDAKEAKISGKVEGLSKQKADAEKARFEAEAKVREARAEALRKRQEEAARAANPPAEEPAEIEAATDEAVAETTPEVAESKPEAVENNPEAVESKPEAEETTPEVAESKPEAAESEPEAAESKPEADEGKAEENQPETGEDKKETGENKS